MLGRVRRRSRYGTVCRLDHPEDISVENHRTIIVKPPTSTISQQTEKSMEQKIHQFTFSQVPLFKTMEHIKVFLRIKPVTSGERKVELKVFGPETSQEEIFEGSMKHLVSEFIEGSNHLVFTYGATNSGKTYTFQDSFLKFSVWVSFFEIYNECFYDLLSPMSNDKKKKTLRLSQDVKGYSYVKAQRSSILLRSTSEPMKCLSHERERLEEDSEKRLEIFKELVCDYAKSPDEEQLNYPPGSEQAEALKMNIQNERIQELMDIVVQKDDAITKLQDLVSHLEETVKDYENTVTTIKRKLEEEQSNKVTESIRFKACGKSVLEAERKHCLEDETTVEEPPAKKDLRAKEKIIEDMRVTLEEQEQTQIEQDKALEANLEENKRLASVELETWKQKYRELSNHSTGDQQQKNMGSEKTSVNENNTELIKLQKELKESEAKYQTDRKKWLEEKSGLINQIKEAENLRNREMKNLAEDRQRHGKQKAEIERLVAQLEEKDNNLQKWREERDQLVGALEVQLKALATNAVQKDKEIAELKQYAIKNSGKESEAKYQTDRKKWLEEKSGLINQIKEAENLRNREMKNLAEDRQRHGKQKAEIDNETIIEELRKELADKDDLIKELKQSINRDNPQSLPAVPLLEEKQDKMCHSVNEEEHSETVLDTSEVSTENGKTSWLPKSVMQLRTRKPDKMETKQDGSKLPVRVKALKSIKRRSSDDMDEGDQITCLDSLW
ncbi:UNVERIFIED_CONTAM: hypothetical protein H355_014587 [Colinus virginianus]|nr:hypothetical protein H355_014587 [Colinus virginianus]